MVCTWTDFSDHSIFVAHWRVRLGIRCRTTAPTLLVRTVTSGTVLIVGAGMMRRRRSGAKQLVTVTTSSCGTQIGRGILRRAQGGSCRRVARTKLRPRDWSVWKADMPMCDNAKKSTSRSSTTGNLMARVTDRQTNEGIGTLIEDLRAQKPRLHPEREAD